MNLHDIGLNRYEKKIVSALIGWIVLSQRELSVKTGISWVTVNKYVNALIDKEIVKKHQISVSLTDEFTNAIKDEWKKTNRIPFGSDA
jgi:DNA-binding transcriptional regulator YhcF (GntR family)